MEENEINSMLDTPMFDGKKFRDILGEIYNMILSDHNKINDIIDDRIKKTETMPDLDKGAYTTMMMIGKLRMAEEHMISYINSIGKILIGNPDDGDSASSFFPPMGASMPSQQQMGVNLQEKYITKK